MANQLAAGDAGVDGNLGIYHQLNDIQNIVVRIKNRLLKRNTRAALAESREFNRRISTQTYVVDYIGIPKFIAGHPNVELPEIRNINLQAAYEIGDLPPPNLLPSNDAAFAALKAKRQNLATLRTRMRTIQWFYNDPQLGSMLNEDATRDDCRDFVDTLKHYIKFQL
ncbi:hypothetical protein CASFOL_033182 [Castilleja foliolosa]|uniref:Uncharacterized protein n=1 Tax=Castilleja foliolosa TaxID=1961234 RepID=A0ABD3C3L9_9LAMI